MVLRNIGQIFGNVSDLGLSDSFPWKHEPRDMGFQKGCHRTRGYFLSCPTRESVVVTWFLAGVAHCDHGVPVVSPGLFNVKMLFVPFHTRLFGNKPWVLSLRGWDKEGVKFQLCGEDLSLLLHLFICRCVHSFIQSFVSISSDSCAFILCAGRQSTLPHLFHCPKVPASATGGSFRLARRSLGHVLILVLFPEHFQNFLAP